jgi:hypothetical protein
MAFGRQRAQVRVNRLFGPIEPAAQFLRLGQSAQCQVKIDCAAASAAELLAQLREIEISHGPPFGVVPDGPNMPKNSDWNSFYSRAFQSA